MLTLWNQRWRDRRDSYRPAGEPINTRRYEVAMLEGDGSDSVAKAFVCRHHYSSSFVAARFRFGLYAIGGSSDAEISGETIRRPDELVSGLRHRGGGGDAYQRPAHQGMFVDEQGGSAHLLPAAPDFEDHRPVGDGVTMDPQLVGVAVFSVPMHPAVLTNVFPCDVEEAAELGRFVLLDQVPANGESWFLSRCFDLLRQRIGLAGVVSFSDPVARTSIDGDVRFVGHLGTIYQALSATYLGRATPRTLRLLPDGGVLSERAISKIRAGPDEKGFDHCAKRLIAFGADRPWEDHDAWLKHWLDRLTRPLRHKGNHRYAWGLNRPMRSALRRLHEKLLAKRPLAYPKELDQRRAA